MSNGRRLFVVGDGKTEWARRYRDIYEAHLSDMGGADLLSEAQAQLCRRAASLAIEAERMEGELSEGKPVDIDVLGRLTGHLGRTYDRLGRNYADVTDTIRDFMRRGVVIRTVINGLTFDGVTIDPMQSAVRDALIGFMAATAQAQAEATKEAQRAGINHAKGSGSAYRGRKPSFDREKLQAVRDMLAQGASVASISQATGLSRQAIYRLQADPAGAEASLAAWSSAAA